MPEIIHSPSGWSYRSEQENGDSVNCWQCSGNLDDDFPIYTNRDGYAFCSEFCILDDHDQDEELHSYIPADGPLDYGICGECGDTAESLMHNNTWRNVEPLMDDWTDY